MGTDGGQEEGWVVCRIFKKKNHLKTVDGPLASSSISGEGRRSHHHHHHLYDVSCDEGALEQILEQMGGRGGGNCKEENYEGNINNYNNYGSSRFAARPFDNNNGGGSYLHDSRFLKLPSLESPKSTSMESQQNHTDQTTNDNNGYHPIMASTENNEGLFNNNNNMVHHHHHPLLEASSSSGLANWVALDRLVASQLNGQTEASRQLACFNDPTMTMGGGYCTSGHDHDHLQLPSTIRSSSSSTSTSTSTQARAVAAAASSSSSAAAYNISPAQDYTSEIDLWNFARSTSSLLSSSEPLCHVSNTSL